MIDLFLFLNAFFIKSQRMKSKSFPVLPVEPPGRRRKEFLWAVWAGEGRRNIRAAERGKGKEPGGEEGLQRRWAERAEKERKAQLGGGGLPWKGKRNHNFKYLKFMEKSVENCVL